MRKAQDLLNKALGPVMFCLYSRNMLEITMALYSITFLWMGSQDYHIDYMTCSVFVYGTFNALISMWLLFMASR